MILCMIYFHKGEAMLRKTISIDEHLFLALEKEGVLGHFKNFSELVSTSLQSTMERMKQENYKKALAQMSRDTQVQEDIKAVEEDFRFSDSEHYAF